MVYRPIQIKYSVTNRTPPTLLPGELAFTQAGNNFFIGSPDGTSGNIRIGHKLHDGVLTANEALVANSTGGIDRIYVANAGIDKIYANGVNVNSVNVNTVNSSFIISNNISVNLLQANSSDLNTLNVNTLTANSSNLNIIVSNQANVVSLGVNAVSANSITVNNITVKNLISNSSTVTNLNAIYLNANNDQGTNGYYLTSGGPTGNVHWTKRPDVYYTTTDMYDFTEYGLGWMNIAPNQNAETLGFRSDVPIEYGAIWILAKNSGEVDEHPITIYSPSTITTPMLWMSADRSGPYDPDINPDGQDYWFNITPPPSGA